MKQFICPALGSEHYSMTDAIEPAFLRRISDGRMSINEALGRFDDLPVGESLVDEDGDVWTRVADLTTEPKPAVETRLASDAQAERLERVATAALQGFLGGTDCGVYPDPTVTAQFSVEMAKALIAELDKQSHPNPFVDEVGL